MRTIRLHIDQALTVGAELPLPAQAGEHAVRVLRLAAGDPLTLFNGDGCDYAATIVAVSKREVSVRIDAKLALANESPLTLTLAQGVARGDKMDLIVQKATELGVARIVPLLTERSEVKLDAARSEKRLSHWRAVAASACEQCGRARVPEISGSLLSTSAMISSYQSQITRTQSSRLPAKYVNTVPSDTPSRRDISTVVAAAYPDSENTSRATARMSLTRWPVRSLAGARRTETPDSLGIYFRSLYIF